MTELPASLPGYALLPNRTVGAGSEATVTLAIDRKRLVTVALKVHRKSGKTAPKLRGMRNEALVLLVGLSSHPNIVRAFGEAETAEYFALALEYAPMGDLFTAVLSRGRLEEWRAADIGAQIADGLAHVHACGFVHNDLKLDNVLVFDEGRRVKLSDFGFVAPIDRPNSAYGQNDACGSPDYAAPEVWFRSGRRGASADVWAFAVVLYAMVTGNFPFQLSEDALVGRFMPPKGASEQFYSLVEYAFEPNKWNRPTLAQLRDHAWFKVHGK